MRGGERFISVCVLSEETIKAERQKRLTAFERAGVENYLYLRRSEDDNKIENKADHIVHRYNIAPRFIYFWCQCLLIDEPNATS